MLILITSLLLCKFRVFFPKAGDHTSTGTPAGVTSEEAGGVEPRLTIWGTDVNVQQTTKKFKQFLENFIEDFPNLGESPISGATPCYLTKLDEVNVCYVLRSIVELAPLL